MRKGYLAGVLVLVGLSGCAQGPPSLGSPALDDGRVTYIRNCATCHGGNGQGGAAPALSSVITTFPDCDIHQQWITLGSDRWRSEVGPTYGATDKEITSIMPSFEGELTAEEIAQVAAFERLSFGAATLEEATAACDLG